MHVEEELKTYLQVLWRYRWVVVACAVIASMAALGISNRLTPLYSATATVRVASVPGGAADYVYISTLTRLSNTYVEIANSEVSLKEVAKRLGLQEQPDVDVAVVPETELIEIRASSPDPALARDIANTLAGLMIEQSVQLYGGDVPTAREILEGQLQQARVDLDAATSEYEDALRMSQTSPDEESSMPNPDLETLSHILYVRQQVYADLLQKYEDARTSEQLRANAITIVEPASLPLRPSKPNVPLNTALGLFAGLAMGVILAYFFESMDDTVRSIEDVQALTPLPILCSIPEFKGSPGVTGGVERAYLYLAPSFHQLRTRLTLTGIQAGAAVSFLITSPEPGAGKSTVAANFATSLAEAGNRVVLVDMDIHRPHIHSILGLSNEKGFGEIVRGNLKWNDVLQNTSTPNLRVVTAGSGLERLPESLTPGRIGDLIKQLGSEFNYVVIDAPAFLSVAEPAMIASKVDSVVVVAARRSTERANLRFTLQQLAELDIKVSGIVMNKMPYLRLYRYYSVQQPKWHPFHHISRRKAVAVQGGTSASKKE